MSRSGGSGGAPGGDACADGPRGHRMTRTCRRRVQATHDEAVARAMLQAPPAVGRVHAGQGPACVLVLARWMEDEPFRHKQSQAPPPPSASVCERGVLEHNRGGGGVGKKFSALHEVDPSLD